MNSLFPISRYYATFCIGYIGPFIWNSLSINIKNTNPLKKSLNITKKNYWYILMLLLW